MASGRFTGRVSLKGVQTWFAAVLHGGCRLKGVQTVDGCGRFTRRLSLKGGANHGWFVAVLDGG